MICYNGYPKYLKHSACIFVTTLCSKILTMFCNAMDEFKILLAYKLQLVIASCCNFSRNSTNGVKAIFPLLNQNERKPVSRLTLNTIPRGSDRFGAQFMVANSRAHNQCHSQRVNETALRYGRVQRRAVECWLFRKLPRKGMMSRRVRFTSAPEISGMTR